MREFARKQNQIQQDTTISFARFGKDTAKREPSHQLPAAPTRFNQNFSRIPVHGSAPAILQPKLAVSAPTDVYEQEADNVAERVMNMSKPHQERAGNSISQNKQFDGKPLQTKRVRENDTGEMEVPPTVHDVLNSSGQPLDPAARAFFEPRFGHDFSQVRVHTNAQANKSAQGVNAVAYTAGRNIVFEKGRYEPAKTEGRHLLAHELTHVIQQGAVQSAGESQKAANQTSAIAVTGSGFRGIQRQQAPVEAVKSQILKETIIQEVVSFLGEWALAELLAGTLELDSDAAWALLAPQAANLVKHERKIFLYFKGKIDIGKLTFENITEDQRKVFSLINEADKETLRKTAIQYSKLFQVLTEMQLQTGSTATDRTKLSAERMSSNKTGDYNRNTLAEMFAEYAILPEMLIAEVNSSSMTGNEPLAKYVRQLKKTYKGDPDKITKELKQKTWWMACGLANLYAMAASRGKAAPTTAGAKQWLKETVLDKAPGKALVQVSNGKFDLMTSQILTDLSYTNQTPEVAKETVNLSPDPKQKNAEKFQSVMEKSMGKSNSRLGLVQGMGKEGHMYIVYKDIDGIWRTMDMYMGIADRPGGGLPYEEEHSTKKLWHKLVRD